MATDNNISFTAADIEKYHRGLLSAKEMHDLEKAALDDPFLADALEGYAVAGVDTASDIAALKKRLETRTDNGGGAVISSARFQWLKIAAILLLVTGAGYFIYQFGFNNKHEIARTEIPAKEEIPAAANNKTTVTDSGAGISGGTTPATLSDIQSTATEKQSDKAALPKGSLSPAADSTAIGNNFITLSQPPSSSRDNDLAAFKTKEPETAGQENNKQFDTAVVFDEVTERRKNSNSAANRVFTDKIGKAKAADNDGITDSMNKSVAANSKKQNYAQEYFSKEKQFSRNIFRGTITDSSSNPLPFANITNIADNVGTYADAKGNFVLTSPDSVLNVQIRSVGFANYNAALRPSYNNIALKEDYSNLNAIVLGNNKNLNSTRSRTSTMVLEEPEPEDGWYNYDTYIANNLNVPETYRSKQTGSGEVEISFEVNKEGEPVNIKIEKSLCESCDKEAIRLIKDGPKFKSKSKRKGRTRVSIAF